MIRVNLLEILPSNPINKIVTMVAVPRVGDLIVVGEPDSLTYAVRSVIWMAVDEDFDYDVQVRFR